MINQDNELILYQTNTEYNKKCNTQSLKYISYFVLLNTTINLIITFILFTEIQLIYVYIKSKNITNTITNIENMIDSVCIMFPEICNNIYITN